jgi:hypothetical protein
MRANRMQLVMKTSYQANGESDDSIVAGIVERPRLGSGVKGYHPQESDQRLWRSTWTE